ncbi:MAG: transglycosylase SLT domain-containing protein [Vannielia sp.]|nr:transglycosylase SLT domain-containing protein [Vannielia sp.]
MKAPIFALLVVALLPGVTAAELSPEIRPVPRISAMGGVLPDGATMPAPRITRLPPKRRPATLPRTRWERVAGSDLWTRSALSALKAHGRPLITMVPSDISGFCPAYEQQPPEKRAEFWVGFLSALARHESTYRPRAVGGGGKWHGLLQILPSTARLYGCRARSGEALLNGPANLSCAIRIMAKTVPRDGKIGASGKGGVAADWGPMVYRKKRADIAAYTRRQSYCRPLASIRPRQRPARNDR